MIAPTLPIKIIFSHGKESGPWGSKIAALAQVAEQRGFSVHSIDYQDLMNPDQRVARLNALLDTENQPVILVGSSMGGYVSLVAASHPRVISAFLMAPALYMPGYQHQQYPLLGDRVTIVHGWQDDIVSPKVSVQYASESASTLHLITGDHRLNAVLPRLLALFGLFLDHSQAVEVDARI